MSDPSNPTYTLAQRMPTPEVAPDHRFVRLTPHDKLLCWHAVVTLEDGHIVRCGLPIHMHPRNPRNPPAPEPLDGP